MATKQEVEKAKRQPGGMPPREDLVSLARESVELFNKRDWARMRELLHDDYTFTRSDGQIQNGPEAGVSVAKMYAAAFPDGQLELQRQHIAGDTIVNEMIGTGTQQGAFMGIQPTNRRVRVLICHIMQVREGKIAAEREYIDMGHVMQQLGVLSQPH
jgi:steroid delta-isomerase-like uncharacterized protein